MHLLLLLSLFFVTLALGSPSDIIYIEKLNADEAQIVDAHDYSKLADIFTTTATYKSGPSQPTVNGIENVEATIAFVIPPEVITHTEINTQSITLKPPFDEQGAAGTASGVIYTTVAYIGQGNATGSALIFFAKFEDSYVKTGDFAKYGGWRISNRSFIPFGAPAGNPNVLPPYLRALL
ncbi:hypothetical protein MMC07_007725 [Pseudocyphellaria aurata]|nr:hypothetical protein [Pseudocyphellaria aurata]